jgi:hypothetical protein
MEQIGLFLRLIGIIGHQCLNNGLGLPPEQIQQFHFEVFVAERLPRKMDQIDAWLRVGRIPKLRRMDTPAGIHSLRNGHQNAHDSTFL